MYNVQQRCTRKHGDDFPQNRVSKFCTEPNCQMRLACGECQEDYHKNHKLVKLSDFHAFYKENNLNSWSDMIIIIQEAQKELKELLGQISIHIHQLYANVQDYSKIDISSLTDEILNQLINQNTLPNEKFYYQKLILDQTMEILLQEVQELQKLLNHINQPTKSNFYEVKSQQPPNNNQQRIFLEKQVPQSLKLTRSTQEVKSNNLIKQSIQSDQKHNFEIQEINSVQQQLKSHRQGPVSPQVKHKTEASHPQQQNTTDTFALVQYCKVLFKKTSVLCSQTLVTEYTKNLFNEIYYEAHTKRKEMNQIINNIIIDNQEVAYEVINERNKLQNLIDDIEQYQKMANYWPKFRKKYGSQLTENNPQLHSLASFKDNMKISVKLCPLPLFKQFPLNQHHSIIKYIEQVYEPTLECLTTIFPYKDPDHYYSSQVNKQRKGRVVPTTKFQMEIAYMDKLNKSLYRQRALGSNGVLFQNNEIKVGLLFQIQEKNSKQYFTYGIYLTSLVNLTIQVQFLETENIESFWAYPEHLQKQFKPQEQQLIQVIAGSTQDITCQLITQEHPYQFFIPNNICQFITYQEVEKAEFKQKWKLLLSQLQRTDILVLNKYVIQSVDHFLKMVPRLFIINAHKEQDYKMGIDELKIGGFGTCQYQSFCIKFEFIPRFKVCIYLTYESRYQKNKSTYDKILQSYAQLLSEGKSK